MTDEEKSKKPEALHNDKANYFPSHLATDDRETWEHSIPVIALSFSAREEGKIRKNPEKMSKSHPSFNCVFICVWGGHWLNDLIWNRGDLKFNFYFRNEINYYVRHMSFGLARGLKRYKNVKCKNYFKLRISCFLLIEMKCPRKKHFKTVPPTKTDKYRVA